MGFYRLLLAYGVVYSHICGFIRGYNIGVISVISFLLLSGFVMTALLRKYYSSTSTVAIFYIDRFVRLFPQLYFYIALTFFGYNILGLNCYWMNNSPGSVDIFEQLLIIPLNFNIYLNNILLPQSWSLGLEAMFYAIFPFILIFRIRLLAAILSFAFFIFAYLGALDGNLWAYKYLPGTLFIFIIGSYIEYSKDPLEKYMPFLFFLIATVLFVLTYHYSYLMTGRIRYVLFGLIVGIPLVLVLKNFCRYSRLNELAGNLSYGVFLNHNLIAALIEHIFPSINVGGNIKMCTVSALSYLMVCIVATAVSYASFVTLERPLIVWRRNMRGGCSVVIPRAERPARSPRYKSDTMKE